MNVAFIKNPQDHIHHKNRAYQKQRKRAEELTEDERLALEGGLNAGMCILNLSERILDEFRRVTDRDAGQQIKIDSDAGELVEMVHCLRTDDRAGGCDRAQWNEVVCGTRSGGIGRT